MQGLLWVYEIFVFLIWIRFVIDYGRSAALYKKICFEGIIAWWEVGYNRILCNTAVLGYFYFCMLLLLYDGSDLDYPHWHAAFPVRLTRLFAHVLCNSPYGLKQTQNMSGSVLLTTEASQLSVGIAEVAYYIENSKITSKKNYICGIIRDFRNVKQLGNTM